MSTSPLILSVAAAFLLAGSPGAGKEAAPPRSSKIRLASQAAKQRPATGEAAPAPIYRGIVVADRQTRRYYHPSDPRKPQPQNRQIHFPSIAAARAAGYRAVQPWRLPIPSLPTRKPIGRSPASPLYPEPSETAPTRPDPNW
jgi:hypothetical protein